MDKIIKETLAFKELSEEEKKARGILGRLYGPCADFINPTRNGRTYSDELWDKVFTENELVKEAFDNGGIPGELDHPIDGREEIDSSKIAIIMPEAPKKDKNGKLIAYFDILDTPNGRIAYALAKYGYKLGISSRGTGDVDEYSDTVIPESYDFKCFDLVLTPSVKDARLSMTEGLEKKTFKQALCESLNNSSTEEKEIMEETLNRLHLLEDEDEKEVITGDVELGSGESHQEPQEVELSYDEKIKQFLSLIYDGDSAPTEEEQEAFIEAFKSIFPEECFSQEGCADKDESKEAEEIIINNEEAIDDRSEELIDSLQKTLTEKTELEKQLREIQEQLAVSDNEVKGLKESVERYKCSTIRLSQEARNVKSLEVKVKSLEEKLNQKESEIKSLNESKLEENSKNKSLNESLSNKDKEIEFLEEQKKELEDSINSLNEKLKDSNNKAVKQNSLVEQYKQFAYDAVERYISFKANMFGVDKNVIMSKLPKNGYDMNDVDTICESLQYNVNKLPFELNSSNIKKIKMTESKKDNLRLPSYIDDEIDDSLLDLAKMK